MARKESAAHPSVRLQVLCQGGKNAAHNVLCHAEPDAYFAMGDEEENGGV